jgi:hypothetical protein
MAETPHNDSSITCPMLDVVSTEYQEQVSATAIKGKTASEARRPGLLCMTCDISRINKAHCVTKHNSATVATERPTMTLDSHESNRQMRCTSKTGRAER